MNVDDDHARYVWALARHFCVLASVAHASGQWLVALRHVGRAAALLELGARPAASHDGLAAG